MTKKRSLLILSIFALIGATPLLASTVILPILALCAGIYVIKQTSPKNSQIDAKVPRILAIISCSVLGLQVLIVLLITCIFIIPPMFDNVKKSDSEASVNLRTLSTAAETYATSHNGDYPENIEAMLEADPPYIDQDYCQQGTEGYNFNCSFNKDGYEFSATPKILGETGSQSFTIKTGGIKEPASGRL